LEFWFLNLEEEMLPIHNNDYVPQRKANPFRFMHNWNNMQMTTVICAIISLLFILIGGRHCYVYGYNYVLDCKADLCTHRSSITAVPVTTFTRSDIVEAETVRVDGIQVVDMENEANANEAENVKLGYSFLIKYTNTEASNGVTELLFSPHNLGRRIAKTITHDVNDYAEGFIDKLRINQGRHLTSLGAMLAFIGFLSMAMVFVLGSWPDLPLPVMLDSQKFL
jgi:hypothetical protein